MYGKTHTKEVRKILSEARSIPIIQLDKKGNFIREWNGIKTAADYYGISPSPIKGVLKKKTYTSCGFIWVYKNEYELYGFNIKEHFQNKTERKRKIIQLSINGEFIKEYESIRQAYRETGIMNITVVCQGKKKTAGGFKWIYKEDFNI